MSSYGIKDPSDLGLCLLSKSHPPIPHLHPPKCCIVYLHVFARAVSQAWDFLSGLFDELLVIL